MISTFSGEYRFLSNFFIEPDWSHVEGEYQVAKCADPDDVFQFAGLNPAQCKSLGRRVAIRKDWQEVKLDVMYALVLKKFGDHKQLREMLRATHPEELREGNRWGDTYWGVYGTRGLNHLGKILMRVREDLRDIY